MQEPDFRFYALYDRVYCKDVLWAAWEQVRANGGAGGPDGVTIDQIVALEDGPGRLVEGLHEALRSRTYRPGAICRVWIPKPDGRQRPLGIPNVVDRVAQMAALRVRITDGSALKLIRLWLRAEVVEQDDSGRPCRHRPRAGTPQGGVLSPLLANAFLHWFDRAFHAVTGPANWAKAKLVRYPNCCINSRNSRSSGRETGRVTPGEFGALTKILITYFYWIYAHLPWRAPLPGHLRRVYIRSRRISSACLCVHAQAGGNGKIAVFFRRCAIRSAGRRTCRRSVPSTRASATRSSGRSHRYPDRCTGWGSR